MCKVSIHLRNELFGYLFTWLDAIPYDKVVR